ncbi:hypothetical protein NARC_80146 [Candidatus Nitrosocosmicus arcticus]|uniref:Uncharacterized protein n=1 Tax=Candidatus Nitrosocosmicus arcticus TaxID=2035267 RepID=A0A557SUZ2_9ARCH|nr:hypothetical protein NARC_80146 [Candidatus Nitrosocosmicus arcticus]
MLPSSSTSTLRGVLSLVALITFYLGNKYLVIKINKEQLLLSIEIFINHFLLCICVKVYLPVDSFES